MLTQRQKISVRRHLGVPFAGTAQAGRLFGWRFEIHVEDLEYRMNNMQPAEEQLLTGVSMGSYRIDGAPSVGDRIVYTINDGTNNIVVPYTVTAADLAFIEPATNQKAASYSISLNSALAINAVAMQYGYSAVGVQPADLFSPPPNLPPYFAELIVSGPSSNTFSLSSAITGTTNVFPDMQGQPSPVVGTFTNTPTGAQQTLYGYLAVCDYLAMGMTQADLSLWLTKGDVASFRQDEIAVRRALYAEYCTQLSRVMGGQQYVQKFGGGSSGGAVA